MLNVVELEKRWLKYKIKSYIPSISISIFIISITILTVFLNIDFKKDEIQKKEIVTTKIIKEDRTIEKVIENIPKENIEVKNIEKTIIKPSLGFMENFHTNVSKQQKESVEKQQIVTPKITEIVADIEPATKTTETKLDIQRDSAEENINHVIQRFKKNNNPVLSLFIAKKYYELGEYKLSYQYAFLTNEINDKIEDSWLIFIKSMVKLDQKDKAIETLKRYISHSNSAKGKILLEDIINGRFR